MSKFTFKMSEIENNEKPTLHQLELQNYLKTNDDGRIVLDLSKICRMCLLERTDLRPLFDEEPYCISDMIMTFVPVQLTPDESLPSKICTQCTSQVIHAVTVKQRIEAAEAALRNFLTDGYLDVKVQVADETESISEKKFEDKNEDTPAQQDDVLIEKSDETIVYEITNTLNENQLSSESYDQVIEEECEFVEEAFNEKDAINENEIAPPVRTSKRNLDKEMKMKNKRIDESKVPDALVCQICEKQFSDVRRYNRHKKIHDDEKQYRCPTCNKGFNERTDLNRHVERHIKSQDESDDYNCPECHMSFKVESDLHIHRSVHRDDGKTICGKCNKEFSTKIQLKRHIRIHYVDKPHKCTVCMKGFPEMGSLTRHFKKHTGEVREKKYECLTCGKRYFDSHSLGVHNRKHSGEKPWSCVTCGKSFIDLRLLNSHKKIHMDPRDIDYKPHVCRYCDKRFTHQSTLTTHLRTHTKEKPYVCSYCGKCFIQSSNLSLHIRVHTGEKPYKCTICERSFASSSTLTMHHRVHSGEKPYNCTVCNKSFARHDLSAHMRTHTGEKPFSCATCNKRFTTSGQLNQHSRTHSGEKPFVCDRCNKACSSSTYLKKHKKNCGVDIQQHHSSQEFVEINSEELKHIPESNSIILQEVSENNDTFYLRIECDQLIHQEIIGAPINEHNLVTLNHAGDGEMLNEIMPIGENGISDNIGMHIESKHIYQTMDPNCMRIQIGATETEQTNIGNEQYFVTSDSTNK